MARLDALNARIGARRARLLDLAALRAVLAAPTPEARLERLRESAAGAALPADLGGVAAAPARAEAALRAAQREEALRLLDRAEGRRARGLLRAFLGLEEAEAVKAVLRGVAHGAPIDATLAAAPPAPDLPDAALRAAATAPHAGRRASTPWRRPARPSRPPRARRSRRGATLAVLELAADCAAHARARTACRRAGEDGRILARHLADRADARNAATLLALEGAAPAVGLLARRAAPASTRRPLAALAADEPSAARRAVAVAFDLAPGALATPWAADVALEGAVLAPLRREARQRPLSLAVVLRHLLERRLEVRRAALVLRASAVGLPGDEILDLVEA